MSAVRIAIYQAQSGIEPAANAERLIGAVRDAATGGAAMLFTPEMSGMLDRNRERALDRPRSRAMTGCCRLFARRRRKREFGCISVRWR